MTEKTENVRRITITEGLADLKLYSQKIEKKIRQAKFVGAKKKSDDKIDGVKVEEFVDNATEDFQSILDLSENRKKLKSAIVQSNASTEIEIGGKKYTVAQAIERKNSIVLDKDLLNMLKAQYARMTTKVVEENNKVDAQINRMLEAFMGKDSGKKVNETDITAISNPYHEKNDYELIDPIGIAEKIKSLEEDIDEFESNVDRQLSISNSTTYIEV